jgi:hypothetical protein
LIEFAVIDQPPIVPPDGVSDQLPPLIEEAPTVHPPIEPPEAFKLSVTIVYLSI